MKFVLIALLVVFAAAQAVENKFVCTLCVDLVQVLKNLVENQGANAVRNYIDSLCGKASGFLSTLCTRVLDFGVDKLIELIENRVDPQQICQKIHAC